MMKKRNCTSLILILLLLAFCATPVFAAGSDTNTDTANNTTDTTADTADNSATKTGGLIALTFDDGPSVNTDSLLDALKERDAKVTFFIVGSRVAKYTDEIKREYAEGHEIGCHTWSHTNLTKLDATGIQSEISQTQQAVSTALGFDIGTMLVRPPGGSYNDTVLANANGPVILWSVDPKDWKYRDAETVKNNIIGSACDGAIIDLHDLYSTSVDGAIAAIDELQAEGYTFVTVSELFRRKGITLENDTAYRSAPNDGVDLGPPTEETTDENSDPENADEETNDNAFPWNLLVFCSIILLLYIAGMTRLILVYKPQKRKKTNEKDNLHSDSGDSDHAADDSPDQRDSNHNSSDDDLYRE